MKIRNMNKWLPRQYFSAYCNGKHCGNFTTEREANEAYKNALRMASGLQDPQK